MRQLSLWPWLIGAFSYIGFGALAINYHARLLGYFVSPPTGWIDYLIYLPAWILSATLLLFAVVVTSITVVMIFSGMFQTAIASHTLSLCGATVPSEVTGLKASASEAIRSVMSELRKLIWIIPFGILIFFIGLIPILTPIAICAGAWLISFQFVDVVLDVMRIELRDRLVFARKNALLLVVYGLTLLGLFAIPLAALFIPPMATAGAAWLLAKHNQANRLGFCGFSPQNGSDYTNDRE